MIFHAARSLRIFRRPDKNYASPLRLRAILAGPNSSLFGLFAIQSKKKKERQRIDDKSNCSAYLRSPSKPTRDATAAIGRPT